MEVDSSYSYHACRGHVGPCVQCPSQWGKERDQGLASSHLLETHKRVIHLVVQGGRLHLHTDTAIWLTSRLLERHQILGDPCGTTEGLLAEPH